MTTVELKLDSEKILFEFPNSYDECTDKQLAQIWNFQQRTEPALFEYFNLLVQLVLLPVGRRKAVLHRNRFIAAFGQVPDENKLPAAQDILQFLERPLQLKKSRAYKLLGWRGPNNDLDGMCFEQLALADTALRAWLSSKNTESLNMLMGILYHPQIIPWSNRWYFCEIYAWLAKFLPTWLKVRLALNFKGVLEQFTTQFPHVYKSKSKGSPFGYDSSFINLSATKFGDYRQTLATPAFRIMVYLDDNAREAAKAKNNDGSN